VADHYQYLASIAMIALFVSASCQLLRAWRWSQSKEGKTVGVLPRLDLTVGDSEINAGSQQRGSHADAQGKAENPATHTSSTKEASTQLSHHVFQARNTSNLVKLREPICCLGIRLCLQRSGDNGKRRSGPIPPQD